MDEGRARLIEGLPAARIELEAQVDVVERDRKVVLVEAADREELVARHDQAGRSHRADLLRQPGALEIAGIVGALEAVAVARPAADPGEHAGMLDRAVGIEQSRADRADLGPQRLAHHQRQPVVVDHLDVIVEEAQIFALDDGSLPHC